MSIVEIAAWIIVLKTVWEWFDRDTKEESRKLIEYEAAMAEYQDTVKAESVARNSAEVENDGEEEGSDAEHPIVSIAKKLQQGREREKREREREKNLERQRQLLIRYPGVLIPAPASHYRQEAAEKLKQAEDREKVSFKQRLKENWKWWLLATIMFLAGYLINQALTGSKP